jgi:hypothetical protein
MLPIEWIMAITMRPKTIDIPRCPSIPPYRSFTTITPQPEKTREKVPIY